ncbi:hypothetical protein [Microcoleus sp. FACHB-672]|uniref:hypothetical protein n=1 Tax=Microcoleus sp. FACHB-672 TaxID=2692825 RepID=UPI00168819A5|nr:hypothetical protein [Microcoleus sp. FACHB-672]MBD2039178.1 hypothetical protein [Microcoleus sp. FACHB-672]
MIHKSFRFITASALLALPLVALSIQSVLAETEAVTFTLTNNSTRVLEAFYASPPSTDDWEEDILGVDVLAPGESVKITINDGREDCKYDFKGRLGPSEDGTVGSGELIESAVEVCDGGTYGYSGGN